MKAFKPWPDRIVRQNTCMNTRACAVLVPIIYKDGEEQAVFEVRSSKLGWQPGDVCFPGGRIDDGDDSALEAALRETKEELGVDPSHIHVWGPLDYMESPVGVTVWPFAAYMDTDDFVLNRGEVDHTFTVPLSWFDEHEPEIGRHRAFPRAWIFPISQAGNSAGRITSRFIRMKIIKSGELRHTSLTTSGVSVL